MKYYTSHCPKCKVLKTLMDNKKIEYTEIDKNIDEDEKDYLAIKKYAEENKISYTEAFRAYYKEKKLGGK